MVSNPLVGHQPSTGTTDPTKLLSTLQTENPDADPDLLKLIIEQKQLERSQQSWAQWVDNEYARCKNARVPFDRQWYINLAFIAGKQYVAPIDVPGYGFRLTVPKAPPWRVRLVINKVRTAVRTECSKLTTSKPIPTVIPATNEDEDFSAAVVAEQILATKFANAEFESTYRSWIWWGVSCGTSFLKMYWDPKKPDHEAKQLPDTPTMPGSNTPFPEALIDKVPGLRKYLQTPQPAVGKICVERVTPFHIYVPNLLVEDLNEQPYLIHVMTKSPLWVKNKYGIDANPDARANNTVLDAATIITKNSSNTNDEVMVKEVWIKPGGHKDFPEGGFLCVINSRVVSYLQKWPYPFPEYPFYKYNGIPTGGFYSASAVEDLIPIQKEYNKKRSQMLEIQNTMGKPKFLYQQGSLNPKKISSEPGQMVPYVAGYDPPIPLPGAEVPVSYVNELQQLQQEFDDISGQHEISRGQTTMSSLTSGTAIAYLQEQDDAKLNYQVSSIENATESMGNHYLLLASHYWSDNRVIRTTGKSNAYEALHWKRGMLKGNTDVKVQTGSALPFSKAARTALLTEMMQNGFVDPQDGLEMMNFGGLDKVMDNALVDKRQAMRENLKLVDIPESMLKVLLEPVPGPNGEPPQVMPPDPMDPQGEPMVLNGDGTPFQPQSPIPVNSWDNHEEHIYWHNHFRKTQEFEMLSDLHKEAFELHVQTHQMTLQSQQIGFGGNVIAQAPQQEMGGGGEQPLPEEQEEAEVQEDHTPDYTG